MSRILKSPEAENDLDEIWWYIAQDNPDNADKLLDEIEQTCRELARFKTMGRNRDELHHCQGPAWHDGYRCILLTFQHEKMVQF